MGEDVVKIVWIAGGGRVAVCAESWASAAETV